MFSLERRTQVYIQNKLSSKFNLFEDINHV